jgi:hypothetical protein
MARFWASFEDTRSSLILQKLEPKRGSNFLSGMKSMKSWLFLMCVAVSLAMGGCGSAAIETVQAVTEDPPDSWATDGKTWMYQASMSKSDEDVLMKFFQLHTSFQGSSDFEGPPKLMVSGKSDRRYYWIRGAKDAWTWSCIHFEAGKFRTSEGTGNPFTE